MPQYLCFWSLEDKKCHESCEGNLNHYLIFWSIFVSSLYLVSRRFEHLPSKFVILPLPLPAAVGTLHRLIIWVIIIGLIMIFLSILIWLFISWFILFGDFMLKCLMAPAIRVVHHTRAVSLVAWVLAWMRLCWLIMWLEQYRYLSSVLNSVQSIKNLLKKYY